MFDDPEARARVGHVLNDKWTLETLLGVGGMGAVYAARHRNGARAAVKVLHADLAQHPEVRERFVREGKAANQVEHPGVVKVIDDDVVRSGPDQGAAYLVMELLDGESIEDRLERGPAIDERELLALLDEVLDVLAAAHERGVIHRDLKPENLFLVRDDAGSTHVKVLDFGLARVRDQASSTTRYGQALGTPSYMSPEQASGRHDEVDGRSDLFSLGATAFRMATGRKVHEGDGPVDQVLKMANVPAARVHDVAPGVSQPVARVIDRALEFKRDARFADARAMQSEVRRSLAELGAPVPVPDALAQTIIAPPPSSAQPKSAPPPVTVRSVAPIEVSARDLERPSPPERPAAAPVVRVPTVRLDPAPPPSKLTPPRDAASEPSLARPPMRRSIGPLVAVLLLGGVGAKLAYDARSEGSAAVDAGVGDDASPVGRGSGLPARANADANANASADANANANADANANANADASANADANAEADAEVDEDDDEEADDASASPAPLRTSPGAPAHPHPKARPTKHPKKKHPKR